MTNTLTILIPCYNEESTIVRVLENVSKADLGEKTGMDIIVVDDASTDMSVGRVEAFMNENPQLPIRLLKQDKNTGKGACIHLGIVQAKGEIFVVQDADLEYSPSDYKLLLEPILTQHADVVYGSRFRGSAPHRVLFFWHTLGNKFLTFLSNLFTQINLTDMETGYKMFRTSILRQITLREKRFGFEPEVTARISRIKRIRIYEVGISYYGRTFDDGKKISWKDGVRSIYCIIKYNLFSRK